MNKREAGVFVRSLARRLDSKNAPAVNVMTIRDIVVVCHECGVKIPKEIDGLLLVKVMQLAIEKGLLVHTLNYETGKKTDDRELI